MQFIVAQSFMKQLKRLTEREQGMVSNTVLGLQYDPTAAKHNLHKVDGNAGWWSAYVNGDLRIILRKQIDGKSMMVICWADHHDAAYRWAKNHVLRQHPTTGMMQLVEIPEVVAKQEAAQGKATSPRGANEQDARSTVPPCEKLGITQDDLLSYGVPELWVSSVLNAKTEDELLEIGEHLPPDAVDAVLKIAVGERPKISQLVEEAPAQERTAKPFESEREKQSWWIVTDDQDLKDALNSTAWETWCVYLHPSQRAIAERNYKGVYRVSGSAGTGKTVVALHHAKHLLRTEPGAMVLITTFSENLAADLNYRVRPLMRPRELERCDTRTFRAFGIETFDKIVPNHPRVLDGDELKEFVDAVVVDNRQSLPKGIHPEFVTSEFERVVDPRGLTTWESYRDALRRGVLRRLSEERRAALWKVFEAIRAKLRANNLMTTNEMFWELAARYKAEPKRVRLYTHIVVDESQDLCEAELAFLSAYAQGKVGLFFAGDIGQRIIRYSFAWKPFGIDLRGKSKVLKVNYRTTRQIRSMADRLMADKTVDADDIVQERKGTISLLSGPNPEFRQFDSIDDEIDGVAQWLDRLHDTQKVESHAIAIFYRSDKEWERAKTAVSKSKYAKATMPPKLCTMLDAKGLEYQVVVVMACDADVIPSPARLAEADIIAGLQEIYDTERNLLYVACTRARDYLLVSSAGIPSELLLDMSAK